MARPNANPTLPTVAFRALSRHRDRIAFAWDGGALTYAGTLDLIARMQTVMVSNGLHRGDCVAVLSGNRADSWCATMAAQALGMRTTALHPLGSANDQRNQLADCDAAALVVDVVEFSERGGELADAVALTLTLGAAPFGTDLAAAAERAGAVPLQNLAAADDVALINYTGGTTGRSKGAMRRHRTVAAVIPSILASFELPSVPRYLAVAPISHVAGSKVVPTLVRGGTVHLMAGFDPERVIRCIDSEQINTTLLVPTMIYALLDCPALVPAAGDTTALPSLELLLYGASPMSPTRLAEGLERIGPVFSQLYGQTECYPIAVLPKADHSLDRPELFASCGFPVPSCDVALLDVEGNPVAEGELGEICVRSPYVMDEYLGQPDLTAHAFRNGWLHTDDIARMDDEGRLYIVDRVKDMIVSGGFNIYPKEIEDILTTHPGVAMAAVFGVPDARWGEAVTAVVVPRPGVTLDATELATLVKDAKGSAHTPKGIEFAASLPSTAVGKIDKKALRAPYWAGHDRQVG